MNDSGARLRLIAVAAGMCAVLILPVVRDASQGWLFPDGTSYLDMASGALRDSPVILLKNAYWSPAYPAILAAFFATFRPALGSELRVVYAVNWCIFLCTTVCFCLLLATLLRWLRRTLWPETDAGSRGLICFSFAFFLLANTNATLWYITPDMLVQGLVYLSAAISLRLFLPDPPWKHSAALGLTLGLGFLAKAAMFPAALLLIAILFLKPPKDRLGRRHSAIALTCFCLAAAPLALTLSLEKHRPTIGDSGKLNYAWFVAGIPPYSGWNGQPPESGTPAHPPRRISQTPLILEFRTPVNGTLPLWYDASYWWEGLRVPIRVRRQLGALARPFAQVHSMQTILFALLAAFAPLCLFNSSVRKAIRGGGIESWILLLWPAATCLMYSMVLFNFRYIVGYVVLIGLGIAALLLQPFSGSTRAKLLFAAALLLLVPAVIRRHPALQPEKDTAATSAAAAQGLLRLGIRPGDEIAVLGHSLDCYYARLAGVRIVAQIWEDPEKIAGLSSTEVRQALARLREIGVKALIARAKPGFVNDETWVAIPRTDIYVRRL